MTRNLSVQAYFCALAEKHQPKYRFTGSSQQDWRAWRDALLPALRATLGSAPPPVPLNPEIQAQWTEHGLIKQRIIFDVDDGLAAVAYVFRPDTSAGPFPIILACHGHGPYGKDSIMGNRGTSDMAARIDEHNYDYGLQMARAGYAVIAIDWRGFGERDDRRKPNWTEYGFGRDLCNLHYLRATIMGMTALGMNVRDGMRALDYICDQDFTDPDRIGVMGLSLGGTMTTWMAVCDERIKAADIICYSNRFADFGMRDVNFCGNQVTPNLYALCDLPDLQGLIAPRPLLVEIGAFDDCFKLDSAMSCFHAVEEIYAAAGVRDLLELDLFEGGHAWGANKSKAFFARHLQGAS